MTDAILRYLPRARESPSILLSSSQYWAGGVGMGRIYVTRDALRYNLFFSSQACCWEAGFVGGES